ncbi:MAG: Ribonuclease BN, partial [uncultured Solirubrobacteraceae bacterium]
MAQTRTETTEQRSRDAQAGNGNDPDAPTELEKSDWKSIIKRTIKEFKQDNLTDWAAALTYYGVLSLAPGLLVLVSLLGLFGTSATQPLTESIAALAPGPARDILTTTVENLSSSSAAGAAFFIGIAAALWSASNYVGAFIRAANAIYEVEEGRPFWKLRPLQIVLTVIGVVILALISVLVVISGPLAQQAGDLIGLGDAAVTIYNIAKWPVIAIILALMIAGLYYIGPNVKHPKFQWVSPGGIIAILLWVV